MDHNTIIYEINGNQIEYYDPNDCRNISCSVT